MGTLRSIFPPCILSIVRRTKQQLSPSRNDLPDDAVDTALLDEDPETNTRDGAKQPEPREIGGPEGPEPTRYGDWEKNGRCIDF